MKKIKQWFVDFKTTHPDAYNLITRALWTFLEVFLAVVLEAVIAMPDAGIEIKATFIVAVSSGLSAIKTMILDFIKRKRIEQDEGDA